MLSEINYCIDVINTTSSKQLVSMCSINSTEYTYIYQEPSRVNCTAIKFIVTPVIQLVNGRNFSLLYEPQGIKCSYTTISSLFNIFMYLSVVAPQIVSQLSNANNQSMVVTYMFRMVNRRKLSWAIVIVFFYYSLQQCAMPKWSLWTVTQEMSFQ